MNEIKLLRNTGPESNGCEMHFPGPVTPNVSAMLKEHGYQYHFTKRLWFFSPTNRVNKALGLTIDKAIDFGSTLIALASKNPELVLKGQSATPPVAKAAKPVSSAKQADSVSVPVAFAAPVRFDPLAAKEAMEKHNLMLAAADGMR